MPCVDFLSVRLEGDVKAEDPEMLDRWQKCKDLHDSWFGEGHDYPLRIYRGIEDEAMVISMGPWADPTEHLEEFVVSEEMGEMLEDFGGVVELRGANHIEATWEEVPHEAEQITLLRYFVDPARAADFEHAFASFIASFTAHANAGVRHVGGWRLEGGWPDKGRDDWKDLLADDAAIQRITGAAPGTAQAQIAPITDDDEMAMKQYVCMIGWPDAQARDDARSAMAKAAEQGNTSWNGLKDVLLATKKVLSGNFVKVDYHQEKKN